MRDLLLLLVLAVRVSSFTPPLSSRSPPFCQQRCSRGHHLPNVKNADNVCLWRLQASSSDSAGPEREGLEKLTVQQLKDQLRDRGLKVSGRKSELIDRLLGAPADDNSSAGGSPPAAGPAPTPPASKGSKSKAAKTPKLAKSAKAKTSSDKIKGESKAPSTASVSSAPSEAKTNSKVKSKSKKSTNKASISDDDDVRTAAEDLAILEEASRIAAEEAIAAAEARTEEASAVAKAKAKAEIEAIKPKGSDAALPATTKPAASLTPEEDMALAARLAKLDDLGDRAFEVLKNLGMVEDSSTIDPASPDYDSSRDDEIADGTVFLD